MPFWLKLLIQFGGPKLLSLAKSWLESKYPTWALAIEQLIDDLKNPDKPNKEARKEAHECIGLACQSDLK